jgi:NADPH-dependent 2,4-dienoyl-CoA reductase/sulfur reductase-like enzyme
MRISSKGLKPSGSKIHFHYQDEEIDALTSDTVASALINADRRSCRKTSVGDTRGVFCGMGVCNECAVEVDGEFGKLACMTPVRDGMTVDSQPATPALVAEIGLELPELELSPDVLVIGGGPAGLAAALAAATGGLEVILVDERAKLGGQYFKQPSEEFEIVESELDTQYQSGRELIGRMVASKVRILKEVKVWGAFGPHHILASGPTSRWMLPGVMTTGAAQTLLRSNQVSPGTRVLVSGNGPLNLQVAAELARAGVTVVALAELAKVRGKSTLLPGLQMATSVPKLVADGLGYVATLAKHRVPMLHGTAVIRCDGVGKLMQATVAAIDSTGNAIEGTERVFEVDAVCVGFGFLPANEIARSLNCQHDFDGERGALSIKQDESGRTSIPEIWVIGDSARVTGAKVAQSRGVLAGVAILRDLGRNVPESLKYEQQAASRKLRHHLRFQSALSRVYQAPLLEDQLADADTIICRCENLSLRQVQEQLSGSIRTSGALKRLTRAGMGKCQGRYCGPILTSMVARVSELPIDEFAVFRSQAPYQPTEIDIIAESTQG